MTQTRRKRYPLWVEDLLGSKVLLLVIILVLATSLWLGPAGSEPESPVPAEPTTPAASEVIPSPGKVPPPNSFLQRPTASPAP